MGWVGDDTASDCERAVESLLDLHALLDCGFIPLLFEFWSIQMKFHGIEFFFRYHGECMHYDLFRRLTQIHCRKGCLADGRGGKK